MQKKLIALAIATAFSAPAFADNANFTFYGKADVSFDMVSTGDGTTTANGATAVSGISKRVVSSNVSKFGFKGSEDLGDGLNAVWQIEQQINFDDAAKNTFASRNTFAGLKSDSYGTVLFGIHDTPYKMAVRSLDVFGDGIADNRALLGAPKPAASAAGFELRPTDVLAYVSPAFSGITAAIATVNLKEANTDSTQKDGSAFSLALMYSGAPFYGSFGYESHKLEYVAAGDKESATRFGFGYTQDELSVGAVYEKTTDTLGAANADKYGHSAFYLGAKYKMGNDAVKVAFGSAGKLASVADSKASQFSLGYDHGLSKRTKVYAVYTKLSNGKGINYAFSQNSGAASTTSGYGTSPSAFSLGMQTTF
ncbi:MAG: porin [Sideroxydans sp.]|nr:porin [Sideroxydans sp.]